MTYTQDRAVRDVDAERYAFIAWWTKDVPEDYRESTRQHMRTFFETHGRFPNQEMHGGWNGWQAAKGMK
ncbi:hypothetical protein [Burkholderia cenocepacia]|uniref:hypothetical protein n=1 Tax=Burkholderia cenocepacia TaxID=95486 RepID=UPI0006BF14BA|nr:hypothetical protein [Burkholderia cenocepacia]KOR22963.1 hypothetical protein ABW54_03990 [Burkholderia cenocepacia]